MHPDDLEEMSSQRICSQCVRESFLSELIEAGGVAATCAYCDDDAAKTWSIGDLTDAVEVAFNDHMERTGTRPADWEYPLYADRELNLTWLRGGQETAEAIEDHAEIPRAAAHDVQAILEDRYDDVERARMGEETGFASDACYEERSTDAASWHHAWESFERALKSEARFFNRAGADMLAAVFDGIERLQTRPRYPAVVQAGPGRRINHLYRARVFQSDSKLEEAIGRPDLHLGSPPSRLASAGRMNAKGISVFYGATNAEVALAEVRPPVGSKVATAKFDIVRPVRLLDLTALNHARDYGSIFDPTLKGRLERVAFLQTLGDRMTQPVMPDDEAFEYLTTQAIADFLATVHSPRLDGIIFPSVQSRRGRNVVLFHSAALVDQMALPAGAKVSGRTHDYDEEGGAPEYAVWEEVPAAEPPADLAFLDPFSPWNVQGMGDELRLPTLKVDTASVEVHHIEWVRVRSTAFAVRRHRFEQVPPRGWP
jgi:RES domain-containing protein